MPNNARGKDERSLEHSRIPPSTSSFITTIISYVIPLQFSANSHRNVIYPTRQANSRSGNCSSATPVEISRALIRHDPKTAKTLASTNKIFAWHRVRSIEDCEWLAASSDRRVGVLHFMLIWTCDDVIG